MGVAKTVPAFREVPVKIHFFNKFPSRKWRDAVKLFNKIPSVTELTPAASPVNTPPTSPAVSSSAPQTPLNNSAPHTPVTVHTVSVPSPDNLEGSIVSVTSPDNVEVSSMLESLDQSMETFEGFPSQPNSPAKSPPEQVKKAKKKAKDKALIKAQKKNNKKRSF